MEHIFLFDVDGTLTPARQPMETDFTVFFLKFCQKYPVYLITGSDREKLESQVPLEILMRIQGYFTCSACEFWHKGQNIYQNTHTFPNILTQELQRFIDQSPYPHRYGRHIEYRTGMLNMSIPGRDATYEQRLDYFHWDTVHQERLSFVKYLNQNFSDYTAHVGGQISIDITPRGWNKSKALKELKKQHSNNYFIFFGDRIFEGGNDRPLAQALRSHSRHNKIYAVDGPQDTWQQLTLMF